MGLHEGRASKESKNIVIIVIVIQAMASSSPSPPSSATPIPPSISSFLSLSFPSRPPPFESAPLPLAVLEELKAARELATQAAQAEIDVNNVQIMEYNAETRRLSSLLSFLHLDPLSHQTPATLNGPIKLLANLGAQLGVELPQPGLYDQAFHRLHQANIHMKPLLSDAHALHQRWAAMEFLLKTRLDEAAAIKNNSVGEQEEIVMDTEKREKEIEYFHAKNREYLSRLSQCEGQLAAVGFNEEYSPENIEALSEQMGAIEKEIADLNNQLSVYHGLPPSVPHARVQFESAEAALARLEEELDKNVAKMAKESEMN